MANPSNWALPGLPRPAAGAQLRKREGARRFRPLELLRLEEAEKRERERRGCQLEISTYFPFLPHHFFSFFLSVFSYRLGKMARPLHTKGTRGKCLPSVLALLTLLASVSVHIAEGISFDMMFQTKCLFQDIENGQASTVEWRAVSIKSIKQHQEEDNVFSIEGETWKKESYFWREFLFYSLRAYMLSSFQNRVRCRRHSSECCYYFSSTSIRAALPRTERTRRKV